MQKKMDVFDLSVNGALALCSGIAFAYGVFKFFKRKVPLFNQLVVCGIGCMMLGRLFNVVSFLTNGAVASGFSVGKLGFFGGFLFLFSASFGQMDGLVDGGEKVFRKYRLIALLAPIFNIALYLPVYFSDIGLEEKIVSGAIFAIFALCSYFNLKHLIIPDVDMGIIRSIRGYNLVALIMTLLSAVEIIVGMLGMQILTIAVSGLLCITYITVIAVLEKGVKKWTI